MILERISKKYSFLRSLHTKENWAGRIVMGEYCCIRIWQLKPGASSTELEALVGVEMTTMQSLIPGLKRFSLFRIHSTTDEVPLYLLILAFAHAEAYTYWRQVEEEAPTYWPNFASLLFRLEQTCTLLNEYVATIALEKFILS